jgi:agmatinase
MSTQPTSSAGTSEQLVRGHPPGHAGIGTTFAGQPLVLEPAGLVGVDVAIVGAPFDDGTSNRPGARFGPRAIRAAHDGRSGRPHMGTGLDPLDALTVVDYGDAEVAPGDLPRSHEHLGRVLRQVLDAGAMPFVLGGDHSLSLPTLRALSERFGPEGYAVVHFDTHADTAAEPRDRRSHPGDERQRGRGVRVSHGTPFRVAVEEGYLLAGNIVQIGLRGTWPGRDEFDWMRAHGFRWHTMDEIGKRGLNRVLDDTVAHARGRAERVYLTIDIDVLDPAFAPGTGTPEPGGLTTRELRGALRRVAGELDLCAADVVEVCPPFDPSGITALAAERVVIDVLTGMAARRTGVRLA